MRNRRTNMIRFILAAVGILSLAFVASTAEAQSSSLVVTAEVKGASSPVAYFMAGTPGESTLNLAEGKPYVVSAKASGVTACLMLTPDGRTRGITVSEQGVLDYKSVEIGPTTMAGRTHQNARLFYPEPGQQMTMKIVCMDANGGKQEHTLKLIR